MGGRHFVLMAVPVVLALAAEPAAASVVSLAGAEELRYRADAGEVNRVTVDVGPHYRVTISDPGADIRVSPGCKRTDAHHVVCTPDVLVSFSVRASDGDDSVALSADPDGHLEFANADGGTGNDTMGVDGAIADSNLHGGPGADTLNGAPQTTDKVDYSGSTVPVRVDLAAGSGGSAGEDRLTSIEDASGGDGPDFLSGTPGENFLNGGAGGDLISGGGGSDIIEGQRGDDTLFGGQDRDEVVGGPGRDLLFGGEGDDVLTASDGKGRRDSADTVGCGPGSDVVGAVRPAHARVRDSDLLTTDCEELELGLPAVVLLASHPLSASALTLGLTCQAPRPRGCVARVLVKEGPRLVASARRRIRRGQIRARLSPEGRQLAARRVMVPVLVRLGIGSRSSAFRLLLPPALS